MRRCLVVCVPKVFTREGADHTGLDAYLQCLRCGHTNDRHVECHQADKKVRAMLYKDWFAHD